MTLLFHFAALLYYEAALRSLTARGRACGDDYLAAHAGWMAARARLERRGFRV